MKEECRKILGELTGKKEVAFTKNGNKAILLAMKYAKSLGKDKVLIQDQGGWLTYYQYPKKLKLELTEIKTNLGIIKDEISCDDDSFFLINSLPAYAFLQDMKLFKGFLINDVSGSIGTENAKIGGIILGSFGEDKPIEVGSGGFIASDEKILDVDEEIDFEKLRGELKNLDRKLKLFNDINKRIKNELKDFEIIHPLQEGMNVIVKFRDEEEKSKIISYCERNKYEFTLCPRYIRVKENAVSIEVKRIKVI